MRKYIYVFLSIFFGVLFIIPFFLNTSFQADTTPLPTIKGVGSLREISFAQFRAGKKLWELSAKSMEDKGDIIFLTDVSGNGISGNGKSFSFYANEVELKKEDHSFVASGNIKFLFSDKKILGEKIEYNAKRDVYTILHGIIYINGKISFSGEHIEFIPSVSKLVVRR